MDLKFVELAKSTRVIVEDCLKVKPDEEVLIVTDTRVTDYFGTESLIESIMGSVKAVGAEANIITYITRTRDGDEIPKLVGAAMKSADVVITLPTFGVTHSSASREASAAGARVLMLPCGADLGRTSDMIYRMMPKSKEEIDMIGQLTSKLGTAFQNGKKVHVTTAIGTDMTMEVGDMKMFINTGLCDKPGMTQYMPTGQLAIGVNPGTANGKVIVDASIVPIKRPLNENITMLIENGYITSIEGDADADIYRKEIESVGSKDAFNIAEIGLGTNKKALVMGDPLEDERVFGSGHIGIGANANFGGTIGLGGWHTDAVFLNATMEIDNQLIMENGVYTV